MKKLDVIIRHSRLNSVKMALLEHNIHGMTVSEVKGFGRQGGHKETYRGKQFAVDFTPKVKVEIVLEDSMLEDVITLLCETAATGAVGDGKIFVTSIDDAVRIRTSERGEAAL
jgi:Nitrogen regulatory protein PII